MCVIIHTKKMRGMREMREMRGMRGMRGMSKCLDEADKSTVVSLASSISKRFVPHIKKFMGGAGAKMKDFYTVEDFLRYSSNPRWSIRCTYNLEFSSVPLGQAFSGQKELMLSKFQQVAKVESRSRGYSVGKPVCHIISLTGSNVRMQVDIYISLQSNAMKTIKALDVSYIKAPSLTEADLNSFIHHTEKLQRMIKAYLKAVKDQVGPGAFHLIERYLVSPQIMDQSISRALPILKKYTRLLKIQSGKTNPHNIPGHRGFYRASGMPLKSSSLLNSKQRIQGSLGLPSGVPVPPGNPTSLGNPVPSGNQMARVARKGKKK